MRVRLIAMMTAAVLLVPVAAASAHVSQPAQPEKKCDTRSIIGNHCE
jgi:hypothetical protein